MVKITVIIGSALSIALWITGFYLQTFQQPKVCVTCNISAPEGSTAPCSTIGSAPCQNLMHAIPVFFGVGFLLFLLFFLINIALAAGAVKSLWFWALVLSPICIPILATLAVGARANLPVIEGIGTCILVPNLLFGLLGLKRKDMEVIRSFTV